MMFFGGLTLSREVGAAPGSESREVSGPGSSPVSAAATVFAADVAAGLEHGYDSAATGVADGAGVLSGPIREVSATRSTVLADDLGSSSRLGRTNLTEYGDRGSRYASHVPRDADFPHDVVVHGDAELGFSRTQDFAPGSRMTPDEVVDAVRGTGGYQQGTPVRLLACSIGGTAFHQAVANGLGVAVQAPTDDIQFDYKGRIRHLGGGSMTTMGPDC